MTANSLTNFDQCLLRFQDPLQIQNSQSRPYRDRAIQFNFGGHQSLRFGVAFFIELGKTFDAFAVMAKALIGLFIQISIDVGILACAVAAIYFTYRYVMMVRRATALRREIDERLYRLEAAVSDNISELRVEL